MLSAVPTPVLIGAVAALVVHFPLLTFALYKLFLLRPKRWLSILVNILLVVLVVAGPTVFLVWFYASGKERVVRSRYASPPPSSGEGGQTGDGGDPQQPSSGEK